MLVICLMIPAHVVTWGRHRRQQGGLEPLAWFATLVALASAEQGRLREGSPTAAASMAGTSPTVAMVLLVLVFFPPTTCQRDGARDGACCR